MTEMDPYLMVVAYKALILYVFGFFLIYAGLKDVPLFRGSDQTQGLFVDGGDGND